MVLQEEEVWKRFVEGFLGRIPILGYLIILLINPSYVVRALDGSVLFRLTKKPAFFEGKFSIDRVADSVSSEEENTSALIYVDVEPAGTRTRVSPSTGLQGSRDHPLLGCMGQLLHA